MLSHFKTSRWILLTLGVFFTHAFATTTLRDYSSISGALKQGKLLRAVLHLGLCKNLNHPNKKTSTNAIQSELAGGFTINAFMIYPAPTQEGARRMAIATSLNMLTIGHDNTPAYNYVRIRIFKDNQVDVFSDILDAKSLKEKRHTRFRCALGEGVSVYT